MELKPLLCWLNSQRQDCRVDLNFALINIWLPFGVCWKVSGTVPSIEFLPAKRKYRQFKAVELRRIELIIIFVAVLVGAITLSTLKPLPLTYSKWLHRKSRPWSRSPWWTPWSWSTCTSLAPAPSAHAAAQRCDEHSQCARCHRLSVLAPGLRCEPPRAPHWRAPCCGWCGPQTVIAGKLSQSNWVHVNRNCSKDSPISIDLSLRRVRSQLVCFVETTRRNALTSVLKHEMTTTGFEMLTSI